MLNNILLIFYFDSIVELGKSTPMIAYKGGQMYFRGGQMTFPLK